jgi:hypothetical protein
LTPLPPEAVDEAWLAVLDGHLAREVQQAGPGQCLRLEALPRHLLEALAARWAAASDGAAEVYLVDREAGEEPWRVGVHRVVARRNAGERVLVALIPPDVKLAAGDSVDVSTFRLLPVEGLWREVERLLEGRLPRPLLQAVRRVLAELKRRRWPVSDSAKLRFLATVAGQERPDPWIVGAALYAIGLIPDFDLLEEGLDQVGGRLGQRNLVNVERLGAADQTPLERLLRLPLADGTAFRGQLGTLLRLFDGKGVEAWGEAIATISRWRPLALEHWPLRESGPPPGQVRVDVDPLKLPHREDDELYVYESSQKLTIAWTTNPPPGDAPGLACFRLEVVSADGEVVWETDRIRAVAGKRPKRFKHLKDLELPSGVYFVRVVPLDERDEPLSTQPPRDPAVPEGKRSNESDDFLLLDPGDDGEDVPPPVTSTTVASYAEAEMLARLSLLAAGRDPGTARPMERAWLTSLGASSETAAASVRFDSQRQYKVRLSQRLRRLEIFILEHPEHSGHAHVTLARASTAPLDLEGGPIRLPAELAAARALVFEALRATKVLASADHTQEHPAGARQLASGVVALADLCGIGPLIERYAAAYVDWLATSNPEALQLDLILADVPGVGRVALLPPTHPLRLLWLLQRQQLARSWLEAAAERKGPARDLAVTWQRGLPAAGLPSLLVTAGRAGFVDAGELPGGWGAYLPPRLPDSRAVLALLQQRLGAPSVASTPTEVTAKVLADKLAAFVDQHPYLGTLVVNVVNPGDAALLVDALVELEARLGEQAALRYELRLFTTSDDTAELEVVGGALRALMDPERQLSDAAARLAGPGRSPLFPKLSWSRKPLRALTTSPEALSAHVTILLDSFPTRPAVSRVAPEDRSSYVHGLVQAAPVRFVGQGIAYRWIRRPAPTSCPELPGAPARSQLLAQLVEAIATAQARVLAPGHETGPSVAVTELDLSKGQQSLLYTAHAISIWVIIIDQNLGLEYFDASDRRERPGYLLDFTPEFAPSGGRRLLLTTRAGEELKSLVTPLVEQLGLDRDSQGAKLLIESMRALSGRLALRLLASPNQAQAALGMALTKLFCEGYGLLSEAMAIPLDAHPELAVSAAGTGLRGDLLLVSADPDNRHLDFLVVETKCHSGAGLESSLRARIHEQVTATAAALRERFEIAAVDDRVDRQVQSWQLAEVLLFYLDRAERYGLVSEPGPTPLRHFLADLDVGYSLTVRRTGLVFRPEAAATRLDDEDPEVPIWVVGRDVIDRLLGEGMRRLVSEEPSEPGAPAPSLRDVMANEPTWGSVRSTFGTASGTGDTLAPSQPRPPVPGEPPPAGEVEPTTVAAPTVPEPAGAGAGEAGKVAAPEFSVLLGDSRPTGQFGLLGAVAAEEWRRVALDLNGCNTISVFGVQGGGKSYTLGSILEMAVQPIAAVNLLPRPLAAVVFHYHQTQDYPPEFVSMVHQNDDPAQVAALAKLGAAPTAVPDVVVLTTADTVDRRRDEFPGIRVEPIAFASRELTVADWRFLMGATGNDSLYLKILNQVMRSQRDDLSPSAIRSGLDAANLSDAQRALAYTRLELAARFIDDDRSLRSLLIPGRVVIVDLRDEFVEKEEALGLFVTMLNVFAGAGMGSDGFNKLMVFDEAHKYLGASLIDQVVEIIREMRHEGVSVVVASQDPVHVPPAVIELSSAVILHRFNAPSWLRHVQKSLAALGDLTAPMLAGLSPGEAYVWVNRATSDVFTRRAIKLRMRPRATKHGGSTRLAIDG